MSWLSKAIGKIPVVGGAINAVAHNVVDPLARSAVGAIPGGGAVLAAGDKLGALIPGGGGDGDGSGLGGLLKSALPVVGAGLAGYEGVKNAKQQQALLDEGLGQMRNAQAPDLSYLTNTANPFAKKIPVVGKSVMGGR